MKDLRPWLTDYNIHELNKELADARARMARELTVVTKQNVTSADLPHLTFSNKSRIREVTVPGPIPSTMVGGIETSNLHPEVLILLAKQKGLEKQGDEWLLQGVPEEVVYPDVIARTAISLQVGCVLSTFQVEDREMQARVANSVFNPS